MKGEDECQCEDKLRLWNTGVLSPRVELRQQWSCPIPGSGSSYTVWMVVTDNTLSHGGGQKRQFTLLHQRPDTLLCVGISSTYNKSKCIGQCS